jgi:ComF family protein
MDTIISSLSRITSLLFPGNCAICGTPFDPDFAFISLCEECRKKLDQELISEPCLICGAPLVSEEGQCTSCRERYIKEEALFISNHALFSYYGTAKNLIGSYKFRNRKELSTVFACYIHHKIESLHLESSTFVPVPCRTGGKKKRGWDPMEEICTHLSASFGLKTHRLLKRKGNRQQKAMAAQEREANISAAISMRRKVPLEALNDAIVLLDDVYTTGATLQACSRALKNQGYTVYGAITILVD